MKLRVALACALFSFPVVLAACDKIKGESSSKKSGDDDDDEDDTPKKKKPAASASASATETASALPPPTASAEVPVTAGPSITVPAGTLRAGFACGAVPRISDEELVYPAIQLGEFQMDAYPYPNDPTKPPKTSVSRQEADSLCRANGKRLCSELEWERACKGNDNRSYEYGAYDKNACGTSAGGLPGKREKCKSAFGIYDMHGLVYEWTNSDWGRGKGNGLATVRGYAGKGDSVRERCASGVGRDPNLPDANVGFRCCSGTPNTPGVALPVSRQNVMDEDPSVPGDTVTALLKAMPTDHQKVDDATVSFDKLWRWHPRDNEEIVIARWVGRPNKRTDPTFFEIVAFKYCNGVPARVGRIRGPVGSMQPPRADNSPEKVTVDVTTDKDKGPVTLRYWYGAVAFEQPAWIKDGNRLEGKKDGPKRPILKLPGLRKGK